MTEDARMLQQFVVFQRTLKFLLGHKMIVHPVLLAGPRRAGGQRNTVMSPQPADDFTANGGFPHA